MATLPARARCYDKSVITLDELKQAVQEACARYAGDDRKARCRFTLAALDAAILIERQFRQAARETASFHVISGSTILPSMNITRMEFEHLSIGRILDVVERHLKEGTSLDLVLG